MEQKEETLATPGVIEKYQEAGKIANNVLQQVISKVKPGVNVLELTSFGDAQIFEQLKGVYAKKKKMEKGIAFPTCISINQICAHYSPLASDANEKEKEQATIKENDVVKIDLGVHIDGYMALVGHTVVAQSQQSQTTGRAADAILAAYNAAQAALRLFTPGNTNEDVTQLLGKVTEQFKTNPLEAVLSHDLQKHSIDGQYSILSKQTPENKVEKHEFQVNEVWSLNVVVSTGAGKAKESDLRTTVYKRAIEKSYQLKSNIGKKFYHQIVEKYPTLCFSLRDFEDESVAKVGVSEAQKHELLNAYPVLTEKQGEIVASFNFTIMILPAYTSQITGLTIDTNNFVSEAKLEDQSILDLIALPMDKKSQKERKQAQKQ